MFGRREHIVKDPVHPVTNLEQVLGMLNVNIAGSCLYCLGEHQVYQSHNRGVAGVLQEVSRLFNLGQELTGLLTVHILYDLFG